MGYKYVAIHKKMQFIETIEHYVAKHKYTQRYTPVYSVNTQVCASIPRYTSIHWYTPVYTSIYICTQVYTGMHQYTQLYVHQYALEHTSIHKIIYSIQRAFCKRYWWSPTFDLSSGTGMIIL